MSIVVTPIPRLTAFAAPALTLGTANTAGTAETTISTDSTLLAFDAVVPDAITFGQSGAAGSAVVTSRRDHAHAMAADPNRLVLIGTAVASDSASVTITGIDATYDTYMIAISDTHAATNGAGLYMRVGDSSGIDSGATDYAYSLQYMSSTSDSYQSYVSTGASFILLGNYVGNTVSGNGYGAVYWLHTPSDGTVGPNVSGTYSSWHSTNTVLGGSVTGVRIAQITVDRVQILMSSGNISSGRLTVWGVAHA